MATALSPICTTVKNRPGVSSTFSLIFREAASDISDREKKALIAISKRISKILFNIIYPFNTDIMTGREGHLVGCCIKENIIQGEKIKDYSQKYVYRATFAARIV